MINLKTQLEAIRQTAIEYIHSFVGEELFQLEVDEYIFYRSIDDRDWETMLILIPN